MNAIVEWGTTVFSFVSENNEAVSMFVDVLGAIATIAAVIVAIIANKNAAESLVCSLKMQEQSKNIDLFDKRVEVMTEIKAGNETAELPLQLLFNQIITDAYLKLRRLAQDKEAAEHDMRVYDKIMRVPDGEGGFSSPMAELAYHESQLEAFDYPEERVKEYSDLCTKYQISHSETGNTEDIKVYNYKDLSEHIGKASNEFNKQKTLLLNMIQEFIKESISPIDKGR